MRRHAKAPSTIIAASAGEPQARRAAFGLACLCVLGLAAFQGTSAPSVGAAESFPGQGFLPNNRAWEMVSPPDKNGGEINPFTFRTRAATDGSAIQFISLSGFGDVAGMGLSGEYIAERSADPDPGDNGWTTHSIMPRQESMKYTAHLLGGEPKYVGQFSPNLDKGIFLSRTALTDAPNVSDALNLYLRDDLRTPGAGHYQLLTDSTSSVFGLFSELNRPVFAGASADFSHAIFESRLALIDDAPETEESNVYEWHDGTVRLASILPNGEAGPGSIAGHGIWDGPSADKTTAHPISADGSRIVFTVPTSEAKGNLYARINGRATVKLNASERAVPDPPQPAEYWDSSAAGSVFFTSPERLTENAPNGGGVYMWKRQESDEQQQVAIDATGGTFTLSFNGASTAPIPFDAPAVSVQSALEALKGPAPGEHLLIGPGNVSVSGGPGSAGATTPYKVTFSGDFAGANVAPLGADSSALTGGASSATPTSTQSVENLTLISPGSAVLGASRDGRYIYFLSDQQLVVGAPPITPPASGTPTSGIFLWHDGLLSFIGQSTSADRRWMLDGQFGLGFSQKQTHVTPDGRHLLFPAHSGKGLLSAHGGIDADHGNSCSGSASSSVDGACRQIYLYSADTDELNCLTCKPSGESTRAGYTRHYVSELLGATQFTDYLNRPLSDDGRYSFFSTGEKLVPGDVNGQEDVYVYDDATGERRLLSSGEDSSTSFLLDASADGKNVFIATREPLSGWDIDNAYDVYDARVDGGFPEPPPPPPSCQGDACQPPPLNLSDPTPSSSTTQGPGNQKSNRNPRCGRGQRKVKARNGKARCVKRQPRRRDANSNRRVGR